jgi:hypothetical protein
MSGLTQKRAVPAGVAPVTLFYDSDPGGAIQIPGSADIKVLNFALALEVLEAELYRQALARLTTGGEDDFGQAITGLNVSDGELDVTYVTEFATIEADHRDFLVNALGGNYVRDAGLKFDFGINSLDRMGVLDLIYAAEQTGVSAYLGGTPALLGSKYLSVAAAILGTEARHTAAVAVAINTLNGGALVETAPLPAENGGKDSALTPDQVLNQGGVIPFTNGTIPAGGQINPISGPNGFVFK